MTTLLKRLVLCSLLLLCLSEEDSLILAQQRVISYDYSNGLEVTPIKRLIEDSLGYIWMGGNNGFTRFDGLYFEDILQGVEITPDNLGAEISTFQIDRKGSVWMSFHEGGLASYDTKLNTFKVRHYKSSDGDNFPKKGINQILIDHNSHQLWMVSVLEGVFVMDMETMASRKVIDMKRPHCIHLDPHNPNHIYISDINGVWLIDKSTLERVKINEYALYKMIIKDGFMYGYRYGKFVLKIDLKTKDYLSLTMPDDNIIRDLIIHEKGIWSSGLDGVFELDFKNNTVEKVEFINARGSPEVLEKVFSMMEDKSGNIWLGSQSGAYVIFKDFQELKCFDNPDNTRYYQAIESPSNKGIYAISYYDSKTVEIDLANHAIKIIQTHLKGPSKMIHRHQKVWILYKNGLAFINNEGQIIEYKNPLLSQVLLNRGIGDMVLGSDHIFYLITSNHNQLVQLNPENDEVQVFPIDELSREWRLKNVNSNKDGIWVGSDKGIWRFDYHSKLISKVEVSNDTSKIFDESIEFTFFDKEGYLWMLSENYGAWKCDIDPSSKELTILKSLNKEMGLINNRPWDLTIYKDSIYVFSSRGGLSQFNPKTKQIKNFSQEQGLSNYEMYTDAIDDKLFILSLGLCYYDNTDFFTKQKPLKVTITPRSLKNSTLLKQDQELAYNENNLSFQFHTVSYNYPRTVKYRTRLNIDEEWVISEFDNRRMVYSDLAAKDYQFEVQAMDRDRQWGPSSYFKFRIEPHYSTTWWFKLLIALLLFSSLFALFKYREQHTKKLGQLKLKMNELENQALRAQMNPHFIFNSLNSIKSFIIHNKREEAADYLTTFSQLIRIVLDNSKKQLISLAEEKIALDLYVEIENIRLGQKFDVTWDIDPILNLSQVYIPPLSLQPFVENSIWHGFMHKEGHGHLVIKITKTNEYLDIQIEDNGVGREKSASIEKSYGRKRSYGIAISKERLAFKNKTSSIQIEDLKNHLGDATGTRVHIKTPLLHSLPSKS